MKRLNEFYCLRSQKESNSYLTACIYLRLTPGPSQEVSHLINNIVFKNINFNSGWHTQLIIKILLLHTVISSLLLLLFCNSCQFQTVHMENAHSLQLF